MPCKVCTQIESRDKLFVPKRDYLWKNVGHHKALVASLGVKKRTLLLEKQHSCY
jgi:hypothetical protein